MEENWQFWWSAGICFVSMTAYMIHWVWRHRQINHRLAGHLTGAIISVCIATQLLHMWLGFNYVSSDSILYDRPYSRAAFEGYRNEVFAGQRAILFLFGCLTVHFLLYAFGYLIAVYRSGKKRASTSIHTALGIASMVGKIMLLNAVWYSAYAKVQTDAEAFYDAGGMGGYGENVEQYLEDWLKLEPNSVHAKYLLDSYHGKDTDEIWAELQRIGENSIPLEKRED